MTQWLRQSTAATIEMGPFVDSTDGVTPETALSLTQAETRLTKNGGVPAQKNDATTATHREEGNYDTPLNATDTNTLGRLRVSVYVAGALPVWRDYLVVPAHVFDAVFTATPWGEAIARGTLQSATGTTAVLAAATSFADDLINGATLVITGGTGAGQSRIITDWVSATDTATVDTWTTTPDNTSTYAVYPTAPGSATSPAPANVVQISGDATAADNLEAAADGTGYNLGGGSVVAASVTGNVGGNVAGSVASVTARVTANSDQIAGSATAATNLKNGALGVVNVTVAAGSTTTVVNTTLTEATNDHYNGRTLVFITGALAGQAASITDYNGGTKALTVSAMTEAPADTDTAVIV